MGALFGYLAGDRGKKGDEGLTGPTGLIGPTGPAGTDDVVGPTTPPGSPAAGSVLFEINNNGAAGTDANFFGIVTGPDSQPVATILLQPGTGASLLFDDTGLADGDSLGGDYTITIAAEPLNDNGVFFTTIVAEVVITDVPGNGALPSPQLKTIGVNAAHFTAFDPVTGEQALQESFEWTHQASVTP